MKCFSINYVPQLNNSVHQQIEATFTRQDVQQRVDVYGNTYGNLFSTRPEQLSKHILKVSEQFSIIPPKSTPTSRIDILSAGVNWLFFYVYDVTNTFRFSKINYRTHIRRR